jgi:hypothetical protein
VISEPPVRPVRLRQAGADSRGQDGGGEQLREAFIALSFGRVTDPRSVCSEGFGNMTAHAPACTAPSRWSSPGNGTSRESGSADSAGAPCRCSGRAGSASGARPGEFGRHPASAAPLDRAARPCRGQGPVPVGDAEECAFLSTAIWFGSPKAVCRITLAVLRRPRARLERLRDPRGTSPAVAARSSKSAGTMAISVLAAVGVVNRADAADRLLQLRPRPSADQSPLGVFPPAEQPASVASLPPDNRSHVPTGSPPPAARRARSYSSVGVVAPDSSTRRRC